MTAVGRRKVTTFAVGKNRPMKRDSRKKLNEEYAARHLAPQQSWAAHGRSGSIASLLAGREHVRLSLVTGPVGGPTSAIRRAARRSLTAWPPIEAASPRLGKQREDSSLTGEFGLQKGSSPNGRDPHPAFGICGARGAQRLEPGRRSRTRPSLMKYLKPRIGYDPLGPDDCVRLIHFQKTAADIGYENKLSPCSI
jgi:hypothetical protein